MQTFASMPAATAKPAQGGAPPWKKRKPKARKAQTSSIATTRPEVHNARHNAAQKLPKPLGPNARRNVTKKTSKLIRKRNELDRALLLQAFRPLGELNANDWLPREEILRQCERLASREREYIREGTEALEERTALYNQDPSEERALDLKVTKTQLWKFKRHLGPYLEAAEASRGDGGDDISSSDSDSDSSDDKSGLVQGKAYSGPLKSSQGDPTNGNVDEEKSSVGLDGAFDDIRSSKKRKRNDVDEKESQKTARKEQASGSTQSTASQSQSGKIGAPKRSKDMEASLAEILNNMSQTKSSQVRVNGASKVEAEEPVEATKTKDTSKKADQTASKPPASSSNSTASDGSVRPWYQKHAKAMLRPDFDDHVRERHPNRRQSKPKQKRKEYLVSGALPVPHLPSPRPDKAKARRSASTDGP